MTNNNENNNNNQNKENKDNQPKRQKREFILNKDVKADTVESIIMSIVEINRLDDDAVAKNPSYERQPIKLIVNTYGGSVYDGFALVAIIDTSITPVHTYLYGKAMSMGFIIFASGHKRFAHPLATLMYHEISNGTHDCLTGIKQTVEQSQALQDAYDEYIFKVSDIPVKKIQESKDFKKDWYMFAQEAQHYGLVDVILKSTRQA